MESLSALLAPSSLVLLAGAVQTAAMLFRNQIIMRCILIFGTALYIIYYLKIVSPPLYEAAFISAAIGLHLRLYGLLLLLLDRSQLLLSSDLLPVYKAMGHNGAGTISPAYAVGPSAYSGNGYSAYP
jgi:hypothetical protein